MMDGNWNKKQNGTSLNEDAVPAAEESSKELLDENKPGLYYSPARQRLSVFIAAVISIAVLGLFFIGMVRIGVITLPFGMNQNSMNPGDEPQEDKLYLALRNGDYPKTADVSYNLSSDQYLKALEDAPYLETYSVAIKTTVSSGSSKRTYTVHIDKKKNGYIAEIRSGAELIRKITFDGTKITETDYKKGKVSSSKTFPATEGFTLASEAGIPSTERFLDKTSGTILEGIENLNITLIRTQELNALRVSYNTTSPKLSETLLISLDLGIVISAQTTAENGEVLYSASIIE
ncbi:MAG: hypothetical protein ACOX4O_01535 [Eubacteriales bacterium]|jgi:hypothetical protein